MPKIWISWDVAGDYIMYDEYPHYRMSAHPREISYELYERVREAEREFDLMQDMLASLVYDYDDEEIVRDCD